ncbi:PilZ domain-containing protein [Planctomycetales bacterium ZRK34]|nr:PilZ domain-containing protein [Planctomycetales bacterium ZRK34]
MIPNTPSRQPSEPLPEGHKPRRFGRLRCEMLRCPLGRVEDLSVSGMRVLGRGKTPVQESQRLWMMLQGVFGELKVKTRVVWTEQTGPRTFEIGFEFVELDDETRGMLSEVARSSMKSHAFARASYDD